jgi:hypothetical protein
MQQGLEDAKTDFFGCLAAALPGGYEREKADGNSRYSDVLKYMSCTNGSQHAVVTDSMGGRTHWVPHLRFPARH